MIGHSLGGVLAIELAKVLEQNGLTGEVVCADGSLLLFKRFMKAIMPNVEATHENAQNFILSQMAFEMMPELQPDAVRTVLLEEKTWENRIDKFISLNKKLIRKREFSDAYLKDIGYGISNRVKMVLAENEEYTGEKMQADITLIRPTKHLLADIDADYQLNRYTNGKVNVEFIEGNHLTMLDNEQLYKIINDISTKDKQS